jgi:hypothetical protein
VTALSERAAGARNYTAAPYNRSGIQFHRDASLYALGDAISFRRAVHRVAAGPDPQPGIGAGHWSPKAPLYYVRRPKGIIWMLTMYPKNVTDSIPAHVLKQIREELGDE